MNLNLDLNSVSETDITLTIYKKKQTNKNQGRSQPFCIEGFLMYIACPIDNRAPKALFARGGPENFLPGGPQNFEFCVFRNGVSLISSTNFQ